MSLKSCLTFIICLLTFFSFAHPGIGVVMDSHGNVYYTDLNHVWKINPEGQQSIAVKNVHTHELYMDAHDNLYGEHEWYEGEATDKWGNYVWCLSADGILDTALPAVEGFLANTTLIRDDQGYSYFAKKSSDGSRIYRQGKKSAPLPFSAGIFEDIRWMHFSPHSKKLYVVDGLQIKSLDNQGKVKLLNQNLKEKSPPFEGVADRHYVFGLWTDGSSNLYVAVYGAQKLVRISPGGSSEVRFTSDKGWSPSGGLSAPDGSIWLMEFSATNKTRIRHLQSDGSSKIYSGNS